MSSNLKRRVLRTIIVVLTFCFHGSTSIADTFVLQSDSTWKGTLTAPAAGWNTSSDYNDTSWSQCSTVWNPVVFGRTLNGIWPINNLADPPRTAWIRRVFNIDGKPSSAYLDWVFDDDGEVYVNGVLVFDDKTGNASNQGHIDISALLKPGTNVVAARVLDNGGFHYAGAYLEAEFTRAKTVYVSPTGNNFNSGLTVPIPPKARGCSD